ncbi:tripartite tricarboxylate transporter TctB family protein [Herbiconiux sp. SYSU D00978]|uniref:tripartite tricarboxylate transporter TctB family protein n=1 Tax=Herbiconiux sp. SYSU D00978 TaxID=2812562 RepID=UPI001A9799E1|nr:tripartite tricarboxylate transporter TctB family protein [Herbiconiux sp. SYSU D00978]
MITARRAGLGASIVLAVIGIAAVLGGTGYGMFVDGGEVGPGFLPVFAGSLVALFAVLDVMGRLKRVPEHDPLKEVAGADEELAADLAAESDVDIFGRTQSQRTRMLAIVLGVLVATLALVQVLGFIPAFGLMLFVIAVFVERRKWLPSLLVTVVTCVVVYLIFVTFLRVPLPEGVFGGF